MTKVDTNEIIIVVTSIALIVALINLYSFWKNRKKKEAEKRLKNLYYPLHSILTKKNKYINKQTDEAFEKFAIEYYRFFLELQGRYLENEICASNKLKKAFLFSMHKHGMESYFDYEQSALPEEVIKNLALFELQYEVDEDGLSELERNLERIEKIVTVDMSKMMKYL